MKTIRSINQETVCSVPRPFQLWYCFIYIELYSRGNYKVVNLSVLIHPLFRVVCIVISSYMSLHCRIYTRHSFSSWIFMQLLYHMRRHCFPKQQEALLQYIWRVASTAPRSASLCFDYSVCVRFCCYVLWLCVFRLLSLYSLMSVLMLSWCGYWVLLLLLAGWIEWSSSKRSLARRCVTCCTTAFTIKFCLRN